VKKKIIKKGDYVKLKSLEFYVKDVSKSEDGIGGVQLAFSKGNVMLKSIPNSVEPGECVDSDRGDFYTKSKASGLYWVEFSGYGYYEKEDYCWETSSNKPTERGAYVIDFICREDKLTEQIVMMGSIFKCPNGCVEGACIGTGQNDVESSQEDVIDTTTFDERIFVCGGCEVDDKCYFLGYRKNGEYCSDKGAFVSQLETENSCENHFECSSNVCISGECVSEGLLKKILNWFKNLFK